MEDEAKVIIENSNKPARRLREIAELNLKEDYQVRVYEEAYKLDERTINLNKFITKTLEFKELDEAEQERMKQQVMAMKYYLTILVERI